MLERKPDLEELPILRDKWFFLGMLDLPKFVLMEDVELGVTCNNVNSFINSIIIHIITNMIMCNNNNINNNF